eukprot:scaffold196127_cov22-Tisochrysis_lutea.AAC.1
MELANVGRIPMGHAATCVPTALALSMQSPFGYQCNLMVYGAGNYRTIEFVKFGTGLKRMGSKLGRHFSPVDEKRGANKLWILMAVSMVCLTGLHRVPCPPNFEAGFC